MCGLKSSCRKRPEPCRKFSFPAQEALNWLSRDESSHERRGCGVGEGLGWPEEPRRSLVTVTAMHIDFVKTASNLHLAIQPPVCLDHPLQPRDAQIHSCVLFFEGSAVSIRTLLVRQVPSQKSPQVPVVSYFSCRSHSFRASSDSSHLQGWQ